MTFCGESQPVHSNPSFSSYPLHSANQGKWGRVSTQAEAKGQGSADSYINLLLCMHMYVHTHTHTHAQVRAREDRERICLDRQLKCIRFPHCGPSIPHGLVYPCLPAHHTAFTLLSHTDPGPWVICDILCEALFFLSSSTSFSERPLFLTRVSPLP